jgi:hypothetical protein
MSDVMHRDRANYWDHQPIAMSLRDVDREYVKKKIERLSRIESYTPPELREDRFPDVEAVQILAYQRVSRFRKLLDNRLVNNRLWDVRRNPGWAADYINYQLVEPRGNEFPN